MCPQNGQNSRRQQFDRFGDDLVDLLMTSMKLSLKDRLILRSVCKQFKRLIFNSCHFLEIIYQKEDKFVTIESLIVSNDRLKRLLNITDNITNICLKPRGLDIDGGIIETILKNCQRLTSLDISLSELSRQMCRQLADKFGGQLKKIDLQIKLFGFKGFLNWYPYIKSMDLSNIDDMCGIFDGNNKLLVTKLSKVAINYSTNDNNRIGEFVDKLWKSLTDIRINIENRFELKTEELNELFEELPKLRNLKKFELTFRLIDPQITYQFFVCLEQMAANCHQLKSLTLNIHNNFFAINRNIFKTMKRFRHLRRLSLDLHLDAYVAEQSFSAIHESYYQSRELQSLKSLTHLTVTATDCHLSDEYFYKKLYKYLPQLQVISCGQSDVTENTLRSLYRLSDLRTVDIETTESGLSISRHVVMDLIRNCRKLQSINAQNINIDIDVKDKVINQLRENNYCENIEVIYIKIHNEVDLQEMLYDDVVHPMDNGNYFGDEEQYYSDDEEF